MNTRCLYLVLSMMLVAVLGMPQTSWTENNRHRSRDAQDLTTRPSEEGRPRPNARVQRKDSPARHGDVHREKQMLPRGAGTGQKKAQDKHGMSSQSSAPYQKGMRRDQHVDPRKQGLEPDKTNADKAPHFSRERQPRRVQPMAHGPRPETSPQQRPHASPPKKLDRQNQNKHGALHQNTKRPPRKITPQGHAPRQHFQPPRRHNSSDRKLKHQPGHIRHIYHRLPPRHDIIQHQNRRYHRHQGRYYWQTALGFMLIRPPLGLVVFSLPVGFHTVISAGLTYYVHGDIYYRRVPSGYEVIEPVRVPGQKSAQDYPEQVLALEVLNVRYGPSQDEAVIAQVLPGMVLDVLGTAPDWLYIEIPDEDIQGWVMRDYVRDLGRG